MSDTPLVEAEPAAKPAADPRLVKVVQIIRNGLSNTPISQSFAAWHALETRLPDIVDAIIQEL